MPHSLQPRQSTMLENTVISSLLTRRSVSPKRLCSPAPNREQLELMVDAALRAPDHAGLLPWRLIEFPRASRERLADLFEQEKRRRDPVASDEDVRRAREHAMNPPLVLAFVVRVERHVLVPLHEQWLSAGAALGNLLVAAHALGFGAIMLSGERCRDEILCAALGMRESEVLAGFVSMGVAAKTPPCAPRPSRDRVLSSWLPAEQVAPVQACHAAR